MAYTTIDDPTQHYNTIVYTGSGSSTSYTVGFQPDWVWVKKRDTETSNNILVDSVRTISKTLFSDITDAELTETNITSFDSNGFSAASSGATNQTGHGYVAWCWKAGGSASSNSDGSVTTSVSANTTAGFSIVSYTGTGSVATFGHGLGAKPNLMIQKKRSGAAAWTVYHDKVDANPSHKYLYLNSTAALADYADHFNDTEPTSSVFTLGTDSSVNGSSATNIMYCFTEKKGYSSFGSYKGNGNADGTFIYTGFRPAWVLNKLTSGADDWQILDNKRNTFNVTNKYLRPNSSGAVTTNDAIDFLSNGFKLRTSAGSWNPSGGSFIYMAFAESPFVNSNGVPNNAR